MVAGRYVLLADRRVGFAIDTYDPDRSLVIDPTVAYSTNLGGPADSNGAAEDFAFGIAVDPAGFVYVAGYTVSPQFPTAHPLQPAKAGGFSDGFVAKLDPPAPSSTRPTWAAPAPIKSMLSRWTPPETPM